MTPRSERTAPAPATLRMRKSRERRRQGDVIVKLEIGPNMTRDLVTLGWLPALDHGENDALARALIGLINRAIAIRVTPAAGWEGMSFTPARATAGPPTPIRSDENARLSPTLGALDERGGLRGLGLGRVQPSKVLGAAEVVDDKPLGVQHCDKVDTAPPLTSSFTNPAGKHAELSSLDLLGAQPKAEPTPPFEVDSASLWGPRLTLWQGWRMWMPEWGLRPDQDGCLVPDYLL
jgi:hypothetical protein